MKCHLSPVTQKCSGHYHSVSFEDDSSDCSKENDSLSTESLIYS